MVIPFITSVFSVYDISVLNKRVSVFLMKSERIKISQLGLSRLTTKVFIKVSANILYYVVTRFVLRSCCMSVCTIENRII